MIQGAQAVQKSHSPFAKYERFAVMMLVSLIKKGIGADAFLWPRMFFNATGTARALAYYLDQQEGIDLIAIRTHDGIGLPIQVKVTEKGNGLTKFRRRHPHVPVVFTGKWSVGPPLHLQPSVELQTAHIVTDSPEYLWLPDHYRHYCELKDQLPSYLQE